MSEQCDGPLEHVVDCAATASDHAAYDRPLTENQLVVSALLEEQGLREEETRRRRHDAIIRLREAAAADSRFADLLLLLLGDERG